MPRTTRAKTASFSTFRFCRPASAACPSVSCLSRTSQTCSNLTHFWQRIRHGPNMPCRNREHVLTKMVPQRCRSRRFPRLRPPKTGRSWLRLLKSIHFLNNRIPQSEKYAKRFVLNSETFARISDTKKTARNATSTKKL